MGLSRRSFTKEFKLAAVRRLEQGVSIVEAARALETLCERYWYPLGLAPSFETNG